MSLNRIKRQLLSHIWFVRITIVILILLFSFILFLGGTHLLLRLTDFSGQSLSQTQGRTNFLILGIGGPGHEAPNLTDTLILASVKLDSGQTTLISLPRDIWVPTLQTKVNSAYHYGLQREKEAGGLILAKSAVSEIINQPVHYAVVVDFSTFAKFIDSLGGINVQIDRSFTDTRFPLPGKEDADCPGDPEYSCRYETVSFSAGLQPMDGTTALKFARSRHAENLDEGTDYARSHRQAQVVKAIQAKLLNLAKNPRNFSLLKSTFTKFTSSLVTDIPDSSRPALLWLAFKARRHPLAAFALSEPDHLYHPPVSPLYDNQWVLVPKDGNPQIIYDYVSSLLK